MVAWCHVSALTFLHSKTSPFSPTEPPPEILCLWPFCTSSILFSIILKITLLLQPSRATDLSRLPMLVNPLAWNLLSPSLRLSNSYFLYNTEQVLYPLKLCLAAPAHPIIVGWPSTPIVILWYALLRSCPVSLPKLSAPRRWEYHCWLFSVPLLVPSYITIQRYSYRPQNQPGLSRFSLVSAFFAFMLSDF